MLAGLPRQGQDLVGKEREEDNWVDIRKNCKAQTPWNSPGLKEYPALLFTGCQPLPEDKDEVCFARQYVTALSHTSPGPLQISQLPSCHRTNN